MHHMSLLSLSRSSMLDSAARCTTFITAVVTREIVTGFTKFFLAKILVFCLTRLKQNGNVVVTIKS